jgi:hypothetical protein
LIRTSGFGFRASAAVFLAALFVYGYRVWDAPLDRTEPHRALVAHQMVLSGDWLLPRLNGELYLRKPPLIYWVEAVAERVTGHAQPWAWRLPSVVGSALLAAVVAAWAGRWFGSAAVGPAGIAVLALVPLFDQDRAADIDALNTAAAVVTALFALELIYGPRRRAWPWVVGLSLSTGAMLLLKGPGGLPPLIGALVGPSLVLRDWRWARRLPVWGGLLAGFAIFAAYEVAAKLAVRHAGLHDDTGGQREAMQRMLIHRWRDVWPAVAAPFTVLVYAAPVSLAVPVAAVLARRAAPGSDRRRRIVAVLATVGGGLLLFVVAGNDNPRYEYVLLPLLGLAVGAVAGAWGETGLVGGTAQSRAVLGPGPAQPALTARDVGLRPHRTEDGPAQRAPKDPATPRPTADRPTGLTPADRQLVRIGLACFAVLFVGLHLGATAKVLPSGEDRIGLIAAAATTVAAAIAWFALGRPVVLAGVIVALLAVPLGDRKNLERQRRSTLNVAAQLRAIVGGNPVAVASENRDTPELFYYAGVPVEAFGERGLASLAAKPGKRWVVLGQNRMFREYQTLIYDVPAAFPHGVTQLAMPKGDKIYVGLYDPPPGASRVITTIPPALQDRDDNDE